MSAASIQSRDDLPAEASTEANRKAALSWTLLFRVLESVPGVVWTTISIGVTIALYSRKMGWTIASGLAGLLLIHECGHLMAAFMLRIPVSAPVFIPYIGAIIDIKEEVHDRWKLALMGISGPVSGSIATMACFAAYQVTGNVTMATLAAGGCIQNLFNLIPMGSLDGGHIVGAISRGIWIPGYLFMSWLVWHIHSPVIWISLIVMLPQVLAVFRPKPRGGANYRRPALGRRLLLGVSYLGLVLLLSVMLLCSTSKGSVFSSFLHQSKPPVSITSSH